MNLNINAYISASILLLYVLIFQRFDPLDLSSSGDAFASHLSRRASSMDIIRHRQPLPDFRRNSERKILMKKLR